MKQNLKQSIKVWFQVNIMSLFYFGYSSKNKDKETKKSGLKFKRNGNFNTPESHLSTTIIITTDGNSSATETLVKSLKNQSIKPAAIWLVCESDGERSFYEQSDIVDVVWLCNANSLGWQKAALTQLVTTAHVVWIDNFMKPDSDWLARNITQYETKNGIYGASGTILNNGEQNLVDKKIGWDGHSINTIQQVNFVENALFFSKTLFTQLSTELFNNKDHDSSPEIKFCHLAYEQNGVGSYVLPNIETNKGAWSTHKYYSLPLSRRAFSFNLFTIKNKTLKTLSESALLNNTLENEIENKHRDFKEELYFFIDKILTHENFSIVRFGDGEMKIVKGESIKTSRFFYTPGDEKHEHNREVLNKSLSFNNSQYFVGFPGRCCVGDHYADSIIELSGLPEKQLTWASVFINANYDEFLSVAVPALQQRKLSIVCFEKSVLKHLPFDINMRFNVGMNAWADDLDKVLPEIESYIEQENVKGEVFIFCAGILSNMLIYKLTKKYPDNTYLDVGSVFDVYLSLGKTRRYLKGNEKQVQHSCTW